MTEGHITKLDKSTSDCFIAPIVITVKKDDSIKLAMDAKPINRQLFKNKYQMPNVDELIDGVSQIVTENKKGVSGVRFEICVQSIKIGCRYS